MLSNHDLLSHLEKSNGEVYRVRELIDPRECEHAAYEEAFRERGKHPWVIFEQSLRADRKKWEGLFSTCNFNSFSLLATRLRIGFKAKPALRSDFEASSRNDRSCGAAAD